MLKNNKPKRGRNMTYQQVLKQARSCLAPELSKKNRKRPIRRNKLAGKKR
jgi:hypothetical protein